MVRFFSKSKKAGFSLIELVIGIAVFAVVITLITGLIVPQATRSVDPIFQVRATELAQGLLNEINAKAFDGQSDIINGGLVRCGDSSEEIARNLLGLDPTTDLSQIPGVNLANFPIIPCTGAGQLGDEGELRGDYNDVDDYNGLQVGISSNDSFENSLGEAVELNGENLYAGFQVQVRVVYDADFNGIDDGVVGDTKLIVVTVTTPNNDTLDFSSYRMNF